MMKRAWMKGMAIVLAAAFVLSLSACKGKQGDGESTNPSAISTEHTQIETQTGQETTGAVSEPLKTELGGSVPASTSQSTKQNGNNGTKKPANTAEAIALWNAAVAGASNANTKCQYSRTLDSAKAIGFNLMDFGVANEFNLKNASLKGIQLPKLSSNEVSSAAVSETGTAYVIQFRLKDYTGNSSSKIGAGGYAYFIDFKEAKGLVNTIADKLSGGALKLNIDESKVKLTLTGGVLTATISKSSGKLSKAQLSFKEKLTTRVTVKGTVLGGNAEIQGHGEGTFTLS